MSFRVWSPRRVYKKVELLMRCPNGVTEYHASGIATLEIPRGARVRLPLWYWHKNRASEAKVVKIEYYPSAFGPDLTGDKIVSAYAGRDSWFRYVEGNTVKPAFGFDHSLTECSNGIHFFRSRKKAEAW